MHRARACELRGSSAIVIWVDRQLPPLRMRFAWSATESCRLRRHRSRRQERRVRPAQLHFPTSISSLTRYSPYWTTAALVHGCSRAYPLTVLRSILAFPLPLRRTEFGRKLLKWHGMGPAVGGRCEEFCRFVSTEERGATYDGEKSYEVHS